jgi:hypothetical protein
MEGDMEGDVEGNWKATKKTIGDTAQLPITHNQRSKEVQPLEATPVEIKKATFKTILPAGSLLSSRCHRLQ